MSLFIPQKSPAGGATTPLNPVVGDEWIDNNNYRWFWNGTYWLSQQQYLFDAFGSNLTTTPHHIIPNNFNLFLLFADIETFVVATHNISNFRTLNLNRANASASVTSLLSVNTSPDGINIWTRRQILLNSHLNVSATAARHFNVSLTTTGAPGTTTYTVSLKYRLARI